ncbi:hypothetical protein H2200_004693 [Cladophialophora chaetospira]|uniref:Uncharacterized protein n=1 Tax=Cladophialophora chaetospira TaxID=386627 RepID=A0AA39CKP6_9EURO|nr:hypothetical protein H2200_004693 [Cladophialophora chaetospira]
MPKAQDNTTTEFTFLNYDNPDHNVSHRKAVKSHVSGKYRTNVRLQTHPRYALPHRGSLPENEATRARPRRNPRPASPILPEVSTRQWHRPLSPVEVGFSGFRVDQFKSFPGQITPCVPKALDYYTQAISPMMEPFLLAVGMANPLMIWMYPLILSHESAYHSAVALSQASLEKRHAPTAIASLEVLHHRRKAVSAFRKELLASRGPPDDAALMTVLTLACLDALFRDDRVNNRKGLALIVALKGGLNNLGMRGLVKAFLVHFDYFWMLETGDSTLFPFNERKSLRIYPRPPFEGDVLSLIETLPPGIEAVARRGALGIDVLKILSRVSTFLLSKTDHRRHDSTPPEVRLPNGQDYPDLFEVCACLQSSPSTEHSLEKNLILAVIMFSFDIHNPGGAMSKVAAYRGSRQELTKSVPLTVPRSAQERACLIWIWMIVLRSWSLEIPPALRTLALAKAFFAEFAESESWTTVEATMQRFFWYPPLEEDFRRVWALTFDAYHETAPMASGTERVDMGFINAAQLLTPSVHAESHAALHESAGEATQKEVTSALPPILTLETYLEEVH